MDLGRGAGRGAVEGLATRLIAIGGLFALAVLLEVSGREDYSERQLTALYAIVLAGFSSTLGFGLIAAYGGRRPLEFLQLAADGVLITALVYTTGGVRSVFGFVYMVWIVYGALRAGPIAAAVTPVAAVAGFAFVAWGMVGGWLPELDVGGPVSSSEAFSALGSHSVAFGLVALLAHRLVRQIERGEEELHELGEIHRRIVDNVSSGLLTVSDTGRVTSFNGEAERITGLGAEQVMGRELGEVLPELASALAGESSSREIGGALDEIALGRQRICFHSHGGERLYLGLSRSVLRDALGRPEGSVVIFQDLTRLVEIEDELRRSERLAAVGQLAAGLAHEIRNPLGALSGAIELLEGEDGAQRAGSARLFAIVRRENTRLNRLVRDFLSYARPGALRREPCALSDVLGDIQELLRSSERAGVSLELDLAEELKVVGDPDALRQVFWNLVLNAAESEPVDGVVRARGWRDDAAPVVRVEVSDRGAGMEPELADRIFEPFFTTKPRGTGLGLATVHQLVERQGGSLQVSTEPGRGTTITVALPATDA